MKNALEGISTLAAFSAQIFVKNLIGKTIIFDAPLSITISDLKLLIQEAEGIPSTSQRLIMGGRTLQDGARLCGYGFYPEYFVHLALGQKGGAYSLLININD